MDACTMQAIIFREIVKTCFYYLKSENRTYCQSFHDAHGYLSSKIH